jgi:phage-related protein
MAIYNLPAGFEDMMSISASYGTEARLRQVEFGDGYIQRTPLGLNSLRRTVDLAFENLTQSERNTLLATLEFVQKNGHGLYIAANELLRNSGNYVIETLNVTSVDGDKTTVSVTLTEVFDL